MYLRCQWHLKVIHKPARFVYPTNLKKNCEFFTLIIICCDLSHLFAPWEKSSKNKIFISAECQITRVDRPWLYFVSCLLTPRFCGFFPTWSYRYSTSTVDESVSAAFFLWMGCSFNVHDALLQALAFVLRNGPYG